MMLRVVQVRRLSLLKGYTVSDVEPLLMRLGLVYLSLKF